MHPRNHESGHVCGVHQERDGGVVGCWDGTNLGQHTMHEAEYTTTHSHKGGAESGPTKKVKKALKSARTLKQMPVRCGGGQVEGW
jgi:hypothetical protein